MNSTRDSSSIHDNDSASKIAIRTVMIIVIITVIASFTAIAIVIETVTMSMVKGMVKATPTAIVIATE